MQGAGWGQNVRFKNVQRIAISDCGQPASLDFHVGKVW